MIYNFEWDPDKAQLNAQKHGITFEQAAEAFKDPMALTIICLISARQATKHEV